SHPAQCFHYKSIRSEMESRWVIGWPIAAMMEIFDQESVDELRKRVGTAHQTSQCRPYEKLEADKSADRIARKPEDNRPAMSAKVALFAWFHFHLMEPLLHAKLFQSLWDQIGFAGRHAS